MNQDKTLSSFIINFYKTYWKHLYILDIVYYLLSTLIQGHNRVGQQAKTYILQFNANVGGYLEDL